MRGLRLRPRPRARYPTVEQVAAATRTQLELWAERLPAPGIGPWATPEVAVARLARERMIRNFIDCRLREEVDRAE